LDELYFVSSFISGLNDELRPTVKMLQPNIIKQAAEKARLQELTLKAIAKKYTLFMEAQPSFSQQLLGNQGNSKDYPNQLNLLLWSREES